mmetsp:Transcript_1177/g.4757  ORF Transcript_1177/g.4757 Transcript_1177/m.4757 type:complete len:183 (+) Transcript_1177:263-811(+)
MSAHGISLAMSAVSTSRSLWARRPAPAPTPNAAPRCVPLPKSARMPRVRAGRGGGVLAAATAGEEPECKPKARELTGAFLIDIVESESGYELWADVPGISKSDVKVTISQGVLTLTGTRKFPTEAGRLKRLERPTKFVRQVRVRSDADESTMKAKVEDGVLHVTVGKLPPPPPPPVTEVQVE